MSRSGGVGVLAIDLGASSGKALIGSLDDRRLSVTEIHRFPNEPVQLNNRLHWDVLRLYHEIKQSIVKSRQLGYSELKSLAVDSWAVDFGLLGRNGELLGNPYHYRDHHTDGVMEQVFGIVPSETIFSHTGIQFLPFNTIYQLYAMKTAGSPQLEAAQTLLMIPDLFVYFLTGETYTEFTNASTTQLLNPLQKNWDSRLIEALGLPSRIFSGVVEPGTMTGTLLPSVSSELNVPPLSVIATAEHDTASAVAAVPSTGRDFAYLSCGTWSLMGTEVDKPVLSRQALDWNFTNEGGVNGTFRLLKNIMGLWLLQECRRVWEYEGKASSYEDLLREADGSRPFRRFIDPDHLQFLNPAHMPNQIRQYCRDTNQPVPESRGETVRCILESLAMKYRLVLERTEALSGKRFDGLHMVGGGIHNATLCQYTANAIGKPVWAGPAEATAIGNMAVQYIALGEVGGLQEARSIIKESFPVQTYEPQDTARWEEAYGNFRRITKC